MRMVSYTLRTSFATIQSVCFWIHANRDTDTPARTHSETAEQETMTINPMNLLDDAT
jgi:hypothetical protein